MRGLAKRGRASRQIERRQEDGGLTEYLAFRVGSAAYALPVAIVREIVRSGTLTPVPRAPRGVLGICSFRGRVVTVIDLGGLLGVACSTVQPIMGPIHIPRVRILMIDVGQETLGYVVDDVLQVYRLAPRDVESTNTIGSDVGAHVTGIARPQDGQEVVLLLDPKALLP